MLNTVSESRGGHRTAAKVGPMILLLRHRSQSTEDEDAGTAVLAKELRAATAQLLNVIQVGMRLSSLTLGVRCRLSVTYVTESNL